MEWLPPYAPDLKPVEHVWGHTKHGDLANFTPADIEELEEAALGSFVRKRGNQRLLEAFFRATGLETWLYQSLPPHGQQVSGGAP